MQAIPAQIHRQMLRNEEIAKPLVVFGGMGMVAGVIATIAIAIFAAPFIMPVVCIPAVAALAGAICVVVGLRILNKNQQLQQDQKEQVELPVPVAVVKEDQDMLRAQEYLRRGEERMALICLKDFGEVGYTHAMCLEIADRLWEKQDVSALCQLLKRKMGLTKEEIVAFVKQHVEADRAKKSLQDCVNLLRDLFWGDLRISFEPILIEWFDESCLKEDENAAIACVSIDREEFYFNRAIDKGHCSIAFQILRAFGHPERSFALQQLIKLSFEKRDYQTALQVVKRMSIRENSDEMLEWYFKIFYSAHINHAEDVVEEAFKILTTWFVLNLFDRHEAGYKANVQKFMEEWLDGGRAQLVELCSKEQFKEAQQVVFRAWKDRLR